MDTKTCSMRKIELKNTSTTLKKDSECKDCNCKRVLKSYYDNKDKISNQRNINYEKIEINYYRSKMIDKYDLKNY